MRLFIGLGNPGRKYENTRHNAGCLVINKLQLRDQAPGLILKKSGVFMNDSGAFVKKLVDQYKMKLPDLWVIHDDLDLALGAYKIQFGVGPRDHNGISDIEEKLGAKDFWRVRVGIENRSAGRHPAGEEYVLQEFTKEEKTVLDKVSAQICKKLETL